MNRYIPTIITPGGDDETSKGKDVIIEGSRLL